MTPTITVNETVAPAVGTDEAPGFGALTTEKGNLPLESLDVALSTSALTVGTELTQGFRNPYDTPLEATYIFPLPPRSAVTALRMEADDRVVEGVLQERQEARENYDRAISEGKRASIAEEERPGVFTMRVGNILPGERVSVRLTLAGMLAYEDGEATLRFPLVVAPRYIPGSPLDGPSVGTGVAPDTDAVPDASRITPPVLLPGCSSPVELSIRADVDPAGLPLTEVVSSLHPIDTEEGESGRFTVRVHPGERADRDFVLRLRLGSDDAVTSSLVAVTDSSTGQSGEGTYALTVLPPTGAETAVRPRDVVFVLDRSGSMGGWKMVAARRAAARIVDTLTSRDRFAVLAFDNRIETPPDLGDGLVDGTDRHRFRAVEHLARMDARGGTEMLAPLQKAAGLLTGNGEGTERERVLILVTDGQVGNEDQILRELAPKLEGVRVHTVGIDVAVNEAFLTRLAALGGGHTELVESEDRLDAAMDAIHRRIGYPVVTDVEIASDGLDLIEDSMAPKVLPALYHGAALVVTGRYRGSSEGTALRVSGRTGGSPWSERLVAKAGDNPALQAIWARARLRDLEDRYAIAHDYATLDPLEKQIVELSLRFGVLCRFTAYVAIDSRVVTDGGKPRQVTQPVEFPQGWEMPTATAAPMRAAAAPRMAAPAGGPVGYGAARARGLPASAELGRMPAPQQPSFASGRFAGDEDLDVPDFLRRGDEPSAAWQESRREASELLRELEAAGADDRRRLLADVRDRFSAMVARLQAADALMAGPLRSLVEDLDRYLGSGASSPAETERLWLRVLDVLRALGGTAGPGRPSRPGPSGPSASGGPATSKPRRAFWRR